MKKILLTIVCVCSFVFTTHAQVYDVKFTKEGAAEPAYTGVNTSLVTLSYNDGAPTVTFNSGQTASEAKSLTHLVKYNITYSKATSAINEGTGDPTTDGNTVWAGAKPRKVATQEVQEPTITGPTLVFKLDDGYNTFTLSAQYSTITLKYDGTSYTVNSSGNEKALSNVQAIYYTDPHQPVKKEAVAPTSTADGNIEYWHCTRCDEGFSDEACTDKYVKYSWVRTMVSGTITWDDSEDVDSKRPESVTVNLFAGGEQTDKSATVTASDNWAFCFTDLPGYNGESKITYSISENEVTAYTTAVDGYNITNTHIHTHADKDNSGYCDNEKCNAEMDVTVTLTKVAGGYYTSFGAPYIYNVKGAGDDLKVYVATSLSEDVLSMTQVGNAAIAAGMGVVIVGTSSSSPETMTATIAHATEADVESDLLFATIAGMETAGNAFFSAVNGIVGFYAYNSDNGAVPAGKAYLPVSVTSTEEPNGTYDAKGYRMVFEDDATGISLTPALSQGEGVFKYLENGKVVIVRNGKKFNVNGQEVK